MLFTAFQQMIWLACRKQRMLQLHQLTASKVGLSLGKADLEACSNSGLEMLQ